MLQVVLMTPSEVAKVRMQTQRNPHPSVASPQPVSKPKYRGSLHCLKVIAKAEGFGGLYKGCSALLCRDCSSSAIYFLTYSALCDWLTPAGQNKPGRYRKASDITCKTSLFSDTLRGESGSQQTSPSTYKTSPRFGPRVGLLFVSFLAPRGHLCLPGAGANSLCARASAARPCLVPQQLLLSLCEGRLRHAPVPTVWVWTPLHAEVGCVARNGTWTNLPGAIMEHRSGSVRSFENEVQVQNVKTPKFPGYDLAPKTEYSLREKIKEMTFSKEHLPENCKDK